METIYPFNPLGPGEIERGRCKKIEYYKMQGYEETRGLSVSGEDTQLRCV